MLSVSRTDGSRGRVGVSGNERYMSELRRRGAQDTRWEAWGMGMAWCTESVGVGGGHFAATSMHVIVEWKPTLVLRGTC